MTIREWQKAVHLLAIEKGWWSEKRAAPELLALIHSEVSEALEEARTTSPVDFPLARFAKSGKPEGFGVELADVVIRVLDLCEAYHIDLESLMELKHNYNKTRTHKHGGKLF